MTTADIVHFLFTLGLTPINIILAVGVIVLFKEFLKLNKQMISTTTKVLTVVSENTKAFTRLEASIKARDDRIELLIKNIDK